MILLKLSTIIICFNKNQFELDLITINYIYIITKSGNYEITTFLNKLKFEDFENV